MDRTPRRVLFICVENSCRSQMAEAFTRIYGKAKVEVYSAGSQPSREVNPKAIETMQELGYDLTGHQSKSLDEVPNIEYDFVFTMGCGEKCPILKSKHQIDWGIPDPKGLSLEEFRKVRDLIQEKVKELIFKL